MLSDFYWLIMCYLAAVNAAAFAYVGLDKQRSRSSSAERFSEVSFFVWAVLFGSLGVFLGMLFFRHKTRKVYFVLGMAALIAQQAYISLSVMPGQ